MSEDLVETLNFLIKAIELAQSKGCYSLTEAKIICEKISFLHKILNPKKQELDTIMEDKDEVINI